MIEFILGFVAFPVAVSLTVWMFPMQILSFVCGKKSVFVQACIEMVKPMMSTTKVTYGESYMKIEYDDMGRWELYVPYKKHLRLVDLDRSVYFETNGEKRVVRHPLGVPILVTHSDVEVDEIHVTY